MKIKVKLKEYSEVCALKPQRHKKPMKQMFLFRLLLKIVSLPDLLATKFKYRKIGMERLGKNEPALFLMNHSSFIDLKIASSILFPRRFSIVCTSDGFVGKSLLMRFLGCIPTKKFVFDSRLVKDMLYAVRTLKSSVLMYPEAGYSIDGTSTTLPESLGKCIKMMGVPVVMITTYGAFARDPLYNALQLRKVKVSADMEYILSVEDIKSKSVEEINQIIFEKFEIDNFRWQQENGVRITESFRADYLNRVLYKCPNCNAEGEMLGKGTTLACNACGKEYELTELGFLEAKDGETEFSHVPDWFSWQRKCVKAELESGAYNLDIPVDIYMLVDTKCLYKVGDGRLTHSDKGFHLTGCDGQLDYTQKSILSYCLNSDFYWYEIGDVISIGDSKALYYCFPKVKGDFVAKTRLATEELYKISKEKRK